MFPPSDWRVLLVPLCMTMVVGSIVHGQSTEAERRQWESMVDRLGLAHLRVGELESQLAAPGPERLKAERAQRLAQGYVQLVEQGRGGVDDDLRTRIDQCLAKWEPSVEDALRIAVSRRDYAEGAAVCERARSLQGSSEEMNRARKLLGHAVKWSGEAEARLEKVRGDLARDVTRESGRTRVDAENSLAQVEELLGEARLRAAWSGYWLAWLDRENAAGPSQLDALNVVARRFAAVLDIDAAFARPEEASIDLRGRDYYSAAIEGMGLVRALEGRADGNATIAIDWMALIQHKSAAESARKWASWWTMVAAVDATDWNRVSSLASKATASGHALEIAATQAFQGNPTPDASAAGANALFALARELNFQRMASLRGRIPQPALDHNPALATLLNGSEHMAKAMDARSSMDRAEAAAQASTAFRSLLLDPAITSSEPLSRSIQYALGWSLLESGQCAEAAPILEKASDTPWNLAERALRLAIVSRERAAAGSPEKDLRLTELRKRYLAEFGNAGTSAGLLVSDSSSRSEPSLSFVSALRAVPPTDESWSDAKRELSRILYWHYRQSTGEARVAHAHALLGVAVPPADSSDSSAIDIVVRRQLECALDLTINDQDRAARLLAFANRVQTAGGEVMDPDLVAEMQCRRAQFSALRGDLAEAIEFASALSQADSVWKSVANVAILEAAQQLSVNGKLSPDVAASIAPVARAERLRADSSQSGASALLLIDILIAADDDASWSEAWSVLQELPPSDSSQLGVLERRGRVGARTGHHKEAIQSLTEAIAGVQQGTVEWYRIKVDLVNLLVVSDPKAASDVLRQHRQLDPNWGPAPFGEQLREAATKLGVGVNP
ncbi:MAG: hypothetical protein O2800_02840 [Planctomycetota bacterium]|nr:hypothetical protein [Planctomycetota bacterium]